jgi:hypothetical protein
MNLFRIVVQILGVLAIIAIITTLLVLHPWQGSATSNNSTNVTVEIYRYDNPFVPNRRLLQLIYKPQISPNASQPDASADLSYKQVNL